MNINIDLNKRNGVDNTKDNYLKKNIHKNLHH